MFDILDLPAEVKRRVRDELPWLTEQELDHEVSKQLTLLVSERVGQHLSKVQKEVEERAQAIERTGQYL